MEIYFVSTYDKGDDYSETVFMSPEPDEILKFLFEPQEKPLWIESGRQYALVWKIETGFYKEKQLLGIWSQNKKSWIEYSADENETIFFDENVIAKNSSVGPNIGMFKVPVKGSGTPAFAVTDIKGYIKAIGKAYGH